MEPSGDWGKAKHCAHSASKLSGEPKHRHGNKHRQPEKLGKQQDEVRCSGTGTWKNLIEHQSGEAKILLDVLVLPYS